MIDEFEHTCSATEYGPVSRGGMTINVFQNFCNFIYVSFVKQKFDGVSDIIQSLRAPYHFDYAATKK